MIKQIKPNKVVYDIAASCISINKIHVCIDLKKREYIVLNEHGVWEAFSFGKTCGYNIVLNSPNDVIDDFIGIVDKYTSLGWEFYELDDIRDLVNWFAKGCMVGEWEIPNKPSKNSMSKHFLNNKEGVTDEELLENVRVFLKSRGISENTNG